MSRAGLILASNGGWAADLFTHKKQRLHHQTKPSSVAYLSPRLEPRLEAHVTTCPRAKRHSFVEFTWGRFSQQRHITGWPAPLIQGPLTGQTPLPCDREPARSWTPRNPAIAPDTIHERLLASPSWGAGSLCLGRKDGGWKPTLRSSLRWRIRRMEYKSRSGRNLPREISSAGQQMRVFWQHDTGVTEILVRKGG